MNECFYQKEKDRTTVAEVEHLLKTAKVRGYGPKKDDPIETNDKGGKQSKLDFRLDLLDPKAMFRLGNVLHEGIQRYSKDNWRLIDTESHLNHALGHIMSYLSEEWTEVDADGNLKEDHLGHAFCRLMFAVAMEGEE